MSNLKADCNLVVYFGHRSDELYYVDSYFDNCYEESWFQSDIAKRILAEIDNVYKVDGLSFTGKHFCDNKPVTFSPDGLSSGSKMLLILLNTDEPYVCASRGGDNCMPFLLEIAESKPISITINNSFQKVKDFDFYCENEDKVYHTHEEFVYCVVRNSNSYKECSTDYARWF